MSSDVRHPRSFCLWICLAQACVTIAACKNDNLAHGKPPPQVVSPGMTPASGARPPDDMPARAAHIRSRIGKYKEWSAAHSPVPRRAITASTFDKVRREVTAADTPALLLLVQNDDANDIRSMAASLLDCVNSNAEAELDRLLKQETDNTRRGRLMEARSEVRTIRAGGTSCR